MSPTEAETDRLVCELRASRFDTEILREQIAKLKLQLSAERERRREYGRVLADIHQATLADADTLRELARRGLAPDYR